jgi:hypothetical protein
MNIDFSMTGINLALICGIALLLQGICFLMMQNPFKNIKKFKVRDYIIFALILCFVIAGIALTVIGSVTAAGLIS